MKKVLLAFLFIFILAIAGCVWFYENTKQVSSNKTFSNFVIAKGSSAAQIGANLESKGFIKNAMVFRIYLKVTNQSSKLPSGEFRLSPSFSLFQTVDALFKGPLEIWVTIPEGLRREEIASKFATNLDRDQAFVDEFLLSSKGQEGYLFPDTYLFPKDSSASAIVKKMLNNFENKTSSLKLTKDQVVLASILERETKTDEERPIVAGILMNRLNAGMALQVDASVQYAIASTKCTVQSTKCDWWPVLSRDDLKINSKYNTYKFPGLPLTSISNPGLSSLKAAANPVASDYFYYIHDKDGVIHYAKTLAEHNANVAKYLR